MKAQKKMGLAVLVVGLSGLVYGSFASALPPGSVTTISRPRLAMPKQGAPAAKKDEKAKKEDEKPQVRKDTADLTFRGPVFDHLAKARGLLFASTATRMPAKTLNYTFNAIDKVANVLRAVDRGAKRAISDVFRPGDNRAPHVRARELFAKVEAYIRKNGAIKRRESAMVNALKKAVDLLVAGQKALRAR